jgi:hypothetical protein
MSQPQGQDHKPSRITSADLAVVGGDVAEVACDSRSHAWARWYSADSGSWSAWWPVAQGAESVAVAGPYGEASALVAISRWKADPQAEAARPGRPLADSSRSFYVISADGVTGTAL